MLGFPAVFYLVKKQSNFLSLHQLTDSHYNQDREHCSSTTFLPIAATLETEFTESSVKHVYFHQNHNNYGIIGQQESKSPAGVSKKLEMGPKALDFDTGQGKKPLKEGKLSTAVTAVQWPDIEFVLKLAAPLIFLSLASFSISSYFSNHKTRKIGKMLTKIVPQLRRLQVQLRPKSLVAMYSSSGGDRDRDAGGTVAKKEQAQEEHYFRKLRLEQLAELKSSIENEIKHHEEEIKRHEEAIVRHKNSHKELEKKVKI